jgi:hypothetical protein
MAVQHDAVTCGMPIGLDWGSVLSLLDDERMDPTFQD